MADLPDFLAVPQSSQAPGGKVSDPGKFISRLRKEKGWTLAEVSKKTGVAISTLSKIENNKSSPTYEVLVRLAEGLGLDFVELMDGGSVTAPRLAIYDTDGNWTVENEGVAPDVEVDQTPEAFARGGDPQLERAVEVAIELLEANPPISVPRPAPIVRTKN